MALESFQMAKKKMKTPEQTPATASTSAPAKRRAPAQKKRAAAPIDVATIGGTEALATASENGGGASATTDRQPSHDEIAEAAYFRHLNRGTSQGDEFNDWLEAERELRDRNR